MDEFFHDAVILRIEALQETQKGLDARMAKMESNVQELLDIFQSWKGAMTVLESLGSVAKPVAAIVGVLAAIVGLVATTWTFFRGGGK